MTIHRYAHCRFACGDKVRERGGRHIGRVNAINGMIAHVTWEDSGWKEQLDLDLLEIVEKARCAAQGSAVRSAPRTVVESPKRQLERELAAMRKARGE